MVTSCHLATTRTRTVIAAMSHQVATQDNTADQMSTQEKKVAPPGGPGEPPLAIYGKVKLTRLLTAHARRSKAWKRTITTMVIKTSWPSASLSVATVSSIKCVRS